MGFKFASFVFCFFLNFHSGLCQDFGYDGKIGPSFWGERYQNCNGGKLQSPIDIEENNVIRQKLPPLKFENFDKPLERVMLKNNGHTVVLSLTEGDIPSVFGGPLSGLYNFSQLHFHWGKTDEEGSENFINNHSFPLELHVVMYKTDYGSFDAAANETDGLTVLSFLYHTSDEDNQNYAQFEEKLLDVGNLNATVDIIGFVSLDDFTTMERKEYFTYKGSLTTPPCSEVVTWIEFKHTVPLSHNQLENFRQLSGQDGKLQHNFRPIQPLHDRIVYFNDPE